MSPVPGPATSSAPEGGVQSAARTRRPAGGRPVGAAGAARRSIQRDLQRREASLRINRRVSGPARGVVRGPAPGGLGTARPEAPGGQRGHARPQASAGPASAVVAASATPPAPVARAATSPAPALPAPVARPRQLAPAPAPTGPTPRTPAPPARPARRVLGGGTPVVQRAPRPAGVPIAPAPLPLRAIPGGATDPEPRPRRRLSTPAVVIASVVLLVLTIGTIVAVQIRVTQISERLGGDLAAVNVMQQRNTALKETNNRMLSAARVDSAIASGQMLEPDVADVRFLREGDQAATVDRALRALATAPVAGSPAASAGAAAGPGDAAATGAGVTDPGAAATTTAGGATAQSVAATSAAAAATGATP